MFNYQRPFAILYYRSLAALRYMGSAERNSSTGAFLVEIFFSDEAAWRSRTLCTASLANEV